MTETRKAEIIVMKELVEGSEMLADILGDLKEVNRK